MSACEEDDAKAWEVKLDYTEAFSATRSEGLLPLKIITKLSEDECKNIVLGTVSQIQAAQVLDIGPDVGFADLGALLVYAVILSQPSIVSQLQRALSFTDQGAAVEESTPYEETGNFGCPHECDSPTSEEPRTQI